MALTDSLDELITSGAITPQLAMKVLQQVRLDVYHGVVGWSGGRVVLTNAALVLPCSVVQTDGTCSLTSRWRTSW